MNKLVDQGWVMRLISVSESLIVLRAISVLGVLAGVICTKNFARDLTC